MRRFTFVTLVLTAVVALLVGAILAGGLSRPDVSAGGGAKAASGRPPLRASNTAAVVPAVNFADVVERINPAVVNIDSTARGQDGRRRRNRASVPDPPDSPFDFNPRN